MRKAKPDSNELPAAVRYFDQLPDTALVDVRTIAILRGVSVATIWREVKRGGFPSAVPKFPGTNATRWRVGDVRRAMRVRIVRAATKATK